MPPSALRKLAFFVGLSVFVLCHVVPFGAADAQKTDRLSQAYSGLKVGRAPQSKVPAAAQAAAAKIAAAFGVRLVGVRVVDVNGARAIEAAVMNPGGDFNEAFQITRLLIDPKSGDLLVGFRHLAAGYRLSGASPGRADGLSVGTGPSARRLSGRN